MTSLAGGCQCGAVRFRAVSLGRSSICHCRMCQKAFGSFFGPLVTAHGLEWTRGAPKRWRSSNVAERGFCADCGTPLTFEEPGQAVEVAVGALDDPALAKPTLEVNLADKVPFFGELFHLQRRDEEAEARQREKLAGVVNRQHPDHDTAEWPPEDRS